MRRGRKGIELAVALVVLLACALSLPAFSLAAPPPNDDYANAQALSGFPASATGTTSEATAEVGEPEHEGEPGGHSIWFAWEAPSSAPVTVDTCGASVPFARIGVYTGASLGALAPVGGYRSTFGPTCDGHSSLSFNALEGVTYRIAVDGASGWLGPVSLAIGETPPPPHDDFDDPYLLSGAKQIIAEGTNAGATKEPGEPDHGGDPGGSSVWFSWTAPESGVASVAACGSSFDAVLEVYEGDALGGLVPLGRSTLADPLCDSGRFESFGVTAGDSYLFALDGATHLGTQPAEVGEFFIDIFVDSGHRLNDQFSRALALGPLPVREESTSSDNEYATREKGEPHHAGRRGGASLWYSWTAQVTGPVAFDTCESNFDTMLAVYRGASIAALQSVAGNDDSTGPTCPSTKRSELSFAVVAGTTYRIAVDGVDAAEGSFTLRRRQAVGVPDRTPPNARVRSVRYRRGHRVAEVIFFTRDGTARLRCKLDRHHAGACTSPQVFRGLRPGRHRLAVFAIDRAGNRDRTPAIAHFTIAPSRQGGRKLGS